MSGYDWIYIFGIGRICIRKGQTPGEIREFIMSLPDINLAVDVPYPFGLWLIDKLSFKVCDRHHSITQASIAKKAIASRGEGK